MELLTDAEHEAIATTATLANQLAKILGKGPDLDEAIAHVHALQQMLLSQAGARAYPGLYRTLGEEAVSWDSGGS